MDLSAYVGMSGVVNRAVEYIKQNILNQYLPDNPDDPKSSALRSGVLLLISAALGILIVVGAGPTYNLFLGSEVYGRGNPVVGQILTGIFVGGGSNAINWIGSFLWGWKASPPSGSLAVIAKDGSDTV